MHNIIVGISNSGKTNLAKAIAYSVKDKGNIIVYDPNESGGWPDNAVKFSSPEKYLEYMNRAENAYNFIDEGKTLWDYDEREADKILYKRRHQGILTFIIAQRAYMVRPNARGQCSKVFAFRQNKKDVEILRTDYHDELVAVNSLQPNQFIASDGYSIQTGTLDYSEGVPPKIIFN